MNDENLMKMAGASILLVEDEPAVLASLRRRLKIEGFQIEAAVTGLMALEMFEQSRPDLVILDAMLPELDGFEVAARMRSLAATPILMLTARDSVEDRVKGLEQGADDYLVKPFAFEELLARIRALLRRSRLAIPEESSHNLEFADIRLDQKSREVVVAANAVTLTPREYDLLLYFLKHPRQVLTRDQIFTSVWGYDHEGSSNLIDVYVKSLREKIEEKTSMRLLQTVRGVGYVLRD